MKILYLSIAVYPAQSVVSIHCSKMCQALGELGHEVVLYGMPTDQAEDINLFEYYGIKKNFKFVFSDKSYSGLDLFRYGFQQAKFAISFEPDLIIARSLYGLFFLINKNIPYVYETHEPLFNPNFKVNRRYIKEFLARKVISSKSSKALIVISEALKKLINLPKNSNINILALHDGADIYNTRIKANLKGYQDKINIGYTGQVSKGRGIELIIEISQELLDCEFHICGEIKENYKKYINKYSNVHFYGFIEPSKIPEYLNSFDILIAPYQDTAILGNNINPTSYMSPVKLFEYMASQKPIITSDFQVLREVFDDYNSILVKADSKSEWINAINKLKNYEFRKKLAKNAYLKLENEYTWQKRASKIIEAVELL